MCRSVRPPQTPLELSSAVHIHIACVYIYIYMYICVYIYIYIYRWYARRTCQASLGSHIARKLRSLFEIDPRPLGSLQPDITIITTIIDTIIDSLTNITTIIIFISYSITTIITANTRAQLPTGQAGGNSIVSGLEPSQSDF